MELQTLQRHHRHKNVTASVKISVFCLRLLARLPMSWLRAAGVLLGFLAYVGNKKRRNVSRINLAIAFPHLTPAPLEALVKLHLRTVGIALLDRVWLWFAPLPVVYSRLELQGFEHLPSTLEGSNQTTLLFVPHFVGLEAAGPAWQAICLSSPCRSGLHRQSCRRRIYRRSPGFLQ